MGVAPRPGEVRWCLDINQFAAKNQNLDLAKASQVPRWRESEVFTPLERDVLECADAMTTGAVFDDSSSAGAIFLGATATESVAGVWTGFDRLSGEIVWTREDPFNCLFDPEENAHILVCRPGLDPSSISAIERLDFVTGEPIWSVTFGSPVPVSHLGTVVVGDATQVVAVDRPPLFLRLVDGAEVPAPAALVCGYGSSWVAVAFPWNDETVEFRSANRTAPCSAVGEELTFAEAVEALGPLATSALLEVGDGWLVGTGTDAVVSGHYVG